MKVFLDECVPKPVDRLLKGHQCFTAQQMGWGGIQNGELLRLVQEHGFELFLTSDQNLGYQQNPEARTIPLLVLPTNHWPVLKTKGDEICAALAETHPGDYVEMNFS
jgi:hypothetical protein